MAGRFAYLEGQSVRKKHKKKAAKAAQDSKQEPLEIVYIRKELLRGVWRQYKVMGGESVSELVEELLSEWLQQQKSGYTPEEWAKRQKKD